MSRIQTWSASDAGSCDYDDGNGRAHGPLPHHGTVIQFILKRKMFYPDQPWSIGLTSKTEAVAFPDRPQPT